MSRPSTSSNPLAWSRVAALALVGVAVAGCSNSGRFDTPYYSSSNNAQTRQFEATGSISRAAPSRSVVSQPLPTPSRPKALDASPPE